MLDLERTVEAGTTIRVWHMEESLEQISAQTNLGLIDGYEQLSDKRKREKLFVNHLLQQQKPNARIAYEEGGKPYLPGSPTTGISISHSGNYASLMLSEECANIGIDIEKNNTAKVLRVRHKFMADEEVALHPTPDEGTDALLAWTTKEALFKLATPPHYDFLEGFLITECHIAGHEGHSLVKDLPNNRIYKVFHLITDAYVMSYCVANNKL